MHSSVQLYFWFPVLPLIRKIFREIKDWVYEVFEGNLMAGGKACSVELSLSQSGADMISELKFIHPTMQPVTRGEVGNRRRRKNH